MNWQELISYWQSLQREALWLGGLIGALLAWLLAGVLSVWVNRRRLREHHAQTQQLQDQLDLQQQAQLDGQRKISGLEASNQHLSADSDQLQAQLQQTGDALREAEKRHTALQTKLLEKEQHFSHQLETLQQAELRLSDSFKNLANKIFEERSEKLNQLNQQQIDTLLKPLGQQLVEFQRVVGDSHKEELAQHRVLQEKLKALESLNLRLSDEANQLTQALTSSVKAQGTWGEQQLERLLELAGLQRGREFAVQYSVKTATGRTIQPDVVLFLPEGKSIVIDAKVSLLAWSRYQAESDAGLKETHLKEHIASLKAHIRNLGEKRYAEVDELNALDFVLMFVPIEAALIEALQTEPELTTYALQQKIAFLSPTNLLATLRTVASIWQVHKQNNNAQEIAKRAGLLYDKFVGFVGSLQQVGDRLRLAQSSYDQAMAQLSSGAGNLIRQTELLRELGARNSKQLDQQLTEISQQDEPQQPKPPRPKIIKSD